MNVSFAVRSKIEHHFCARCLANTDIRRSASNGVKFHESKYPGTFKLGYRPLTCPQHPNMPMPKFLKRRVASKSTLKATRDATPAPDVPADHEKETSSKTLVMAAVVPTYADNLTEAWAAAHKELPKAQGVEKFLNRVGTPITDPIWCPALMWLRRECTE